MGLCASCGVWHRHGTLDPESRRRVRLTRHECMAALIGGAANRDKEVAVDGAFQVKAPRACRGHGSRRKVEGSRGRRFGGGNEEVTAATPGSRARRYRLLRVANVLCSAALSSGGGRLAAVTAPPKDAVPAGEKGGSFFAHDELVRHDAGVWTSQDPVSRAGLHHHAGASADVGDVVVLCRQIRPHLQECHGGAVNSGNGGTSNILALRREQPAVTNAAFLPVNTEHHRSDATNKDARREHCERRPRRNIYHHLLQPMHGHVKAGRDERTAGNRYPPYGRCGGAPLPVPSLLHNGASARHVVECFIQTLMKRARAVAESNKATLRNSSRQISTHSNEVGTLKGGSNGHGSDNDGIIGSEKKRQQWQQETEGQRGQDALDALRLVSPYVNKKEEGEIHLMPSCCAVTTEQHGSFHRGRLSNQAIANDGGLSAAGVMGREARKNSAEECSLVSTAAFDGTIMPCEDSITKCSVKSFRGMLWLPPLGADSRSPPSSSFDSLSTALQEAGYTGRGADCHAGSIIGDVRDANVSDFSLVSSIQSSSQLHSGSMVASSCSPHDAGVDTPTQWPPLHGDTELTRLQRPKGKLRRIRPSDFTLPTFLPRDPQVKSRIAPLTPQPPNRCPETRRLSRARTHETGGPGPTTATATAAAYSSSLIVEATRTVSSSLS
ncbi:hypothetical protein TraAM80_04492 [Trypanosoma rangeli]|uniref:Uncharacterized protein n=1 Tax=Trypanosoma rangeli TaxID=5698 RepID=A0A422NJA5_TRYRA|nr:uncharacterized protein TraAM80_04492 [Trypanosoma rangeli]RNF05553.1 hypothetical protein TraAM80_04492 [Trypanosoma rangeli]|eukprot:RNF05553.1 hypothetical protein TraAM80_04492 [Trypanosoma rangeli]